MPPSSSAGHGHKQLPAFRRTEAPRLPSPPPPPPAKRYRSMVEIMRTARHAPAEDYYGRVTCEQCRSGDRADELLLCDKCDKGFHMLCTSPIVARIPIGPWFCPSCSDHRPVKKMYRIVGEMYISSRCKKTSETFRYAGSAEKTKETIAFYSIRRSFP
ncbi:hypothetical protein RJ639_013968 [Escallonia herrerae]|uniref:PHD-type domain-containing protein n=1 Tax=Escallonia herrerae TaxID=1293975 RepID=A0AA88VQ31_9ASTE|nr:hypothetical protein RJ639_013968 [Escallonia herrerae]